MPFGRVWLLMMPQNRRVTLRGEACSNLLGVQSLVFQQQLIGLDNLLFLPSFSLVSQCYFQHIVPTNAPPQESRTFSGIQLAYQFPEDARYKNKKKKISSLLRYTECYFALEYLKKENLLDYIFLSKANSTMDIVTTWTNMTFGPPWRSVHCSTLMLWNFHLVQRTILVMTPSKNNLQVISH